MSNSGRPNGSYNHFIFFPYVALIIGLNGSAEAGIGFFPIGILGLLVGYITRPSSVLFSSFKYTYTG